MTRDKLAEYVARRLLSEMEDNGGLDDFCEKLSGYPEKYLSEIAWAAMDHIDLCGMLKKTDEKT